MANKEHLEILKQGVDVWNNWRQKNPDVIPDLSGEVLCGFFFGVNPIGLNCCGVNFRGAILSGVNLRGTDFSKADLGEADLSEADLSDSNLVKTDFSKVNLSEANLIGANLIEADLSGANLFSTKLAWANLFEANLHRVNLVFAILSKSNITGTCLYGTARDDWKIDDIKCDYVYWDYRKEIRTPKDHYFRAGEFEELYKQLPTIDYYFEKGFTPIDAVLMDQVVQAINEKHPKFELKLDSFHSRGQPHAKFTVLHKEIADEAQKQIAQRYEQEIKYLEGQRDYANEMIFQLMEKLKAGDTITIQAGRDVSLAKDQALLTHNENKSSKEDRNS